MVSIITENPASDIPDRVRNLARQVADEIHEELGGDTEVIWFGSWIRGDASPHSDIDLALRSPTPADPVKIARLRDWIDELPTLFSIDLVNLEEASPRLVAEILDSGVRLD